jgi:hypothetical protein
MKPEIIHLNLVNPLYYTDASINPFEQECKPAANYRETLFCFELKESISNKFEPNKSYFPGNLIFAGIAHNEESLHENKKTAAPVLELPRGNYLFAQIRDLPGTGIPGRDSIISLAMEIQNEGLWQRLKLGNHYYLRYLYEDNSMVTQIFRPITAGLQP